MIPCQRRSPRFLFLGRSILSSTVLALAFIMFGNPTNGVCDRLSWWSAALVVCSTVDRAGLHDGSDTLGGRGRSPQGVYSPSLSLCILVEFVIDRWSQNRARPFQNIVGRRGNDERILEYLEAAIAGFIRARLSTRLARSHGKYVYLPALVRYILPQLDPAQVP